MRTKLKATISSAAQIEDRLLKSQGTVSSMFGAFESSDKSISREYSSSSSRSGDAYGRDRLSAGEAGFVSNPLSAERNDTSMLENVSSPKNDNPVERSDSSDKRQRVDKQDVKRRWQELSKQAFTISETLASTSTSKKKTLFRDTLFIVDEVSQLPAYIDAPGESFMSLLYPKLREIARATQEGKMWVASVYDLLHQGYTINREQRTDQLTHAVLIPSQLDRLISAIVSAQEKVDREHAEAILVSTQLRERNRDKKGDAVKVPEEFRVVLETLVTEGQKLSVKLEEETMLTDMLRDVDDWHAHASSMLADKQVKGREKHRHDLHALVSLVNRALALPIALLDEKLNRILHLYQRFFEAQEEISRLLYYAAVSRHTIAQRKGGNNASELVKYDIKECRIRVGQFKAWIKALIIPGLKDYEELVDIGETWISEVKEATDATISIKRVEKLLSDGEKLPFDFSMELSLLREKRQLAKEWLEKVKTSVLRGNNRHPKRGDNATTVEFEKPNFEMLKRIVSEGGQHLSDDSVNTNISSQERAQNRELSRVVSLVEAAEEWQLKLRETVSNVEADSACAIAELTELLSEAENMPIVMDEIHILKAHLKLLEWGKRVRKLREPTGRLKFKDAKDLLKDLDSIYDALDKQARAEVAGSIKIAEEAYVRETHKEGQHWIAKSKDLIQGNTTRKQAPLYKLREAYNLGSATLVDLSAEVQPIYSAIKAAENWIIENEGLLLKLNLHFGTVDVTDKRFDVSSEPKTMQIDDADQESVLHFNHSSQRSGFYTSGKVDIFHLTRVANASNGISADFSEISAFRQLFDRCNNWLKEVKSKCPVRQSKRKVVNTNVSTRGISKEPKPSVSDMTALLQEMNAIGIDFPEEEQKVSMTIKVAEEWSSQFDEFHARIHSSLEKSVLLYSSLPTEERFPFPCLAGIPLHSVTDLRVYMSSAKDNVDNGEMQCEDEEATSQQEDTALDAAIVEEESIWTDLNSIMGLLDEKVNEYDDFGLSVQGWEELSLLSSIFQWVRSVRKLLCDPDWEQVSKDEILGHIKDAFCINKFEGFLERSVNYLSNIEFPTDIFTDLMKLAPVDDEIKENIEEESRRSTRKKADFNWADRIAKSTNNSKKRNLEDMKSFPVEATTSEADTLERESKEQDDGHLPEAEDREIDAPKAKKAKKSKNSKAQPESIEDDVSSSPVVPIKPKISISFLKPYQDSVTLLNPQEALMDYWLRSLLLLLGRHCEATVWLEEAQRLRTIKSSFTSIFKRINVARSRQIPKKYR